MVRRIVKVGALGVFALLVTVITLAWFNVIPVMEMCTARDTADGVEQCHPVYWRR